MTFLSLTDSGISQEIIEPYLALLLYTHRDPRVLDSCHSVGKLSDRKYICLIWMDIGIKKGLSAGGRVRCSVERKLYSILAVTSYALLFWDITMLNCCILNYICSTEKESSSLFDI